MLRGGVIVCGVAASAKATRPRQSSRLADATGDWGRGRTDPSVEQSVRHEPLLPAFTPLDYVPLAA